MDGTHKYEHMYSWNMHDDELCDYWMQTCWLWSFYVLGGVIKIEPSTGQRHPTRGTGRWLPPFLV
jgi:hypothetical protein